MSNRDGSPFTTGFQNINAAAIYLKKGTTSLIMVTNKRMKREASTIEAMIRIYCRNHHNTSENLCEECNQLLQYAFVRLKNCPFQEKKTSCGKCLIHCYKPGMRIKIREIMRYVGPRMLLHHPILGIMHTLDGLRKTPEIKTK